MAFAAPSIVAAEWARTGAPAGMPIHNDAPSGALTIGPGIRVVGVPKLSSAAAAEVLVADVSQLFLVIRAGSQMEVNNNYFFGNDAAALRVKARVAVACPTPDKSLRTATIAANLDWAFSTAFKVDILLPVGISFYTFTQIAFLVDAYRGKVARYRLPHYALFVTYFPHLIAGPILHHSDMIPQFERSASEAAGPASDPVRPDDLRDRPVQEDLPRRRHPAAGRARLRPGDADASIRPGSARWPIPSSSISISPAIPTWRSASR